MSTPALFPSRRFSSGKMPLLPAAMAAMAAPVMAGPWAAMNLTITDTVQLVLPSSEPGKTYQLQACADLKTWPAVGEPVFGTGDAIELWPSSLIPPSGQQFFRIICQTEPEGGSAPWRLAGTSLLLNEGRRTVKYQFKAEGAGTWQAGEVTKPFTWTWLRTGLNAGKARVTWTEGEGAYEDLAMDFTGPLLGQFVRDRWSGGLLLSTAMGTFGPVPADNTPVVPTTLTGRRIALADGSVGSILALDTVNAGKRILDGRTHPVSYSWLVTGGSAVTLTASFSATHGEEYRLVFSSPQNGSFVRRTFTEGVFRDEDTGVFTLSGEE